MNTEAKPFISWAEHVEFALSKAYEGLSCEFGVWMGGSLDHFIQKTDRVFHAFDSFEGLPENWLDYKAGHLSLGGVVPKSFRFPEDRVIIHKGWFEDTIPVFLRKYTGPVTFIHIDCDLYSSTKTVFKHLKYRIVSGTVIVFDEYITGIEDERQAFLEAGFQFKYMSRHVDGGSVAVRIS